jgi:hypothetical protein
VEKRRHFAMSVPDPRKTAEAYKYAFGTEVVGETDSSLAEGVFLPDGVINWGGVQKNPGGYGNEIGPPHGFVQQFAERRATAAAEMAARIRPSPEPSSRERGEGGSPGASEMRHSRARAELALCRQAKLRLAERGGRVRVKSRS